MTSESFARAFIRQQIGEYMLLGITSMTAKQRERIEALRVVDPHEKARAVGLMIAAKHFDGRPPRQSTGRMRVLSMGTGEIAEVRA